MDVRRRMLFKKKASSSGSTGGSYTINLNSQWEATTAVPNPDSTLYDGVYRSSSNYNVNSGVSIMYITIKDCSSFKMYIRSYAESSYDYVMVSQLDQTINGNTSYSNTTLVKTHTRGNQLSGTALSNYTLVEFTGISSGEHVITVVYRKDSSVNSGDDRGYVLIEKMQEDSGNSGGDYQFNIDNYLTIEALEDGLTTSLSVNACEYCIDGDGNWKSLAADTSTESINKGQTLSFRGNLEPTSGYGIGTFTISKACNLKGNCMSMLFKDNAINNYSLSGKSYVFYRLFYNCKTIKSAKNLILSATVLGYYCYSSMFQDCNSLTTAPELPATTLASSCYSYMFEGCTSLTTAPELPATTLASSCYSYMFNGTNVLPDCSNINFNSTSIVYSGGLRGLFAGTKVTDTDLNSILPKNSNGKCCLPVTTLAEGCYEDMFTYCTSLTTAPELPATTLAKSCYRSMFNGCYNLTTAPALPATKLAQSCYSYMFCLCYKLTIAPALPATTLASYCYYLMFYCCSDLTTAPELPATTLAEGCYERMFYCCSDLNKITMLATDISATACLSYWVYSVASSGTFTKAASMTSLPAGLHGIPSGWTVEDSV